LDFEFDIVVKDVDIEMAEMFPFTGFLIAYSPYCIGYNVCN